MPFDIGALTDVGRWRQSNEDVFGVFPLRDGALCLVADGMGGHQAGEVASQLALDVLRERFEGNEAPAAEALVEAIQSANQAILRESQADEAKRGMGTTIVCALLGSGRAELANVGDSPAFLVRGEGVERLTQDHSLVAEELARGAIDPEEAVWHPYRHVLTRCLGLESDVEVQLYDPLDLQPGDAIILCSDGLTEHVRPEELPGAVKELAGQAAAEALVKLANERGGSDNVTVVVARWKA
jgi:protein phosphatase